MTRLTITRPDDWHLHLRDGDVLASVLPDTARRFARAIVMPNLNPPIITTEQAWLYRERILAALPSGLSFQPLMTLFLTEKTSSLEIAKAKRSGFVHGIKYYPAHATTNAHAGISHFMDSYPVFAAMEECGLPLLMHGEVIDRQVDVFDREAVFIERHLEPLVRAFPALRIVLEHITTCAAVEFVVAAPTTVAATITAHHLLLNRNAMFDGGLRAHYYCLPLLKREVHRQALIAAATSGNRKFFLGSDSAPHLRQAKESACGCAGIYTAHAAIELYAEAFEQSDALSRLEAFASFHGPDFYQLPRNLDTITLEKRSWSVPEEFQLGSGRCVPLRAGGEIAWQVVPTVPLTLRPLAECPTLGDATHHAPATPDHLNNDTPSENRND